MFFFCLSVTPLFSAPTVFTQKFLHTHKKRWNRKNKHKWGIRVQELMYFKKKTRSEKSFLPLKENQLFLFFLFFSLVFSKKKLFTHFPRNSLWFSYFLNILSFRVALLWSRINFPSSISLLSLKLRKKYKNENKKKKVK